MSGLLFAIKSGHNISNTANKASLCHSPLFRIGFYIVYIGDIWYNIGNIANVRGKDLFRIKIQIYEP